VLDTEKFDVFAQFHELLLASSSRLTLRRTRQCQSVIHIIYVIHHPTRASDISSCTLSPPSPFTVMIRCRAVTFHHILSCTQNGRMSQMTVTWTLDFSSSIISLYFCPSICLNICGAKHISNQQYATDVNNACSGPDLLQAWPLFRKKCGAPNI